MRAVFLQVCQRLTVVSYCMPGSPQCQVESAILYSKSRARSFSAGWPSITFLVHQSFIFLGGAHEIVGDAHGVIGVLEEDGAVGFAVDGRVIALLDQHVRLALFLHLALDEFHDIRVVDVQDHHLGRAARLAAALDHARERIKAFHEAHRAGGDAAARKRFLAAAQAEKFVPVPEPHLKSMPSVCVRPMIDSMLSWTELMKHAEHCGLGCTPTLNHTGELKAIFCSTSRWVSSSRNASRESSFAK